MKQRLIFTTLIVFFFFSVKAQDQFNALTYSQNFYGGTTRSISMGGAVGALGGDFSSLSTNPAGIAIFRRSEFTFTPTFLINNTNSKFENGHATMDDMVNFNLNNFGLVAAFEGSGDWEYANFGFGYNRLNSFKQHILARDINNNHSLLSNFVDEANSLIEDDSYIHDASNLNAYYERLFYDTYLLSYDTVHYEYYSEIIDAGFGQEQQKTMKPQGGIGEYVFSFGANYSNTLYLGGTLGIQSVRYEETGSSFKERDIDKSIPDFREFNYTEDIETSGMGFNLKVGAIYRPVNFIRIGCAIHTPTFMSLTDKYYNHLFVEYDTPQGGSLTYDYDPEDDYGQMPEMEFNYELRTPYKIMPSFAIVVGKYAMLSADYEYVDYTSMKLTSDSYDFVPENEKINQVYQPVHNIKGGAEFLIGPLAVRGGVAYYGNPYNLDNETYDLPDASRIMYSAGIGIASKDFYFDLGGFYSEYLQNRIVYNYDGYNSQSGMPEVKFFNLKSKVFATQIMATFGFRF